MTQKVKEYYVY